MRLKATRSIFNGHVQTTYNLLAMSDTQIKQFHRKLNLLNGRTLRASRQPTLNKIREDLESLAMEMGHSLPTNSSKNYLQNKIRNYKRQNAFLLNTAIYQAIVNICVIYEDLVNRLVMKYYEENINRIPGKKESVKNEYLISAILRGDNIHHTLAQNITDDLMRGSVESWHETLKKQGMKTLITSPVISELFLVRNCIVHNKNIVSSRLHDAMPQKYTLHRTITLTVKDVEDFKDQVHRSGLYIISEYSRLHPVNLGTWL